MTLKLFTFNLLYCIYTVPVKNGPTLIKRLFRRKLEDSHCMRRIKLGRGKLWIKKKRTTHRLALSTEKKILQAEHKLDISNAEK